MMYRITQRKCGIANLNNIDVEYIVYGIYMLQKKQTFYPQLTKSRYFRALKEVL